MKGPQESGARRAIGGGHGERDAALVAALRGRVDALLYAGRLGAATDALAEGVQLADLPRMPAGVAARYWLLVGRAAALRGCHLNAGHDAAIAALERARELAEAADDRGVLAAAIDEAGMALHYRRLHTGEGTIEASLQRFLTALELRQLVGDHQGACRSTFRIGLMYRFAGDLDRAFEQFVTANDRAVRQGWALEESYAIRHLGIVHLSRNEPSSALPLLRRSLALREGLRATLYLPFSHLAVGDALLRLGEFAETAMHYRRARDLADELSLAVASIATLAALGALHRALGEIPAAYQMLALARARAGALSPGSRHDSCHEQLHQLGDATESQS